MIQKVRELKRKITNLNKQLNVADKHIEGKREAYEKSLRFKENLEKQLSQAQQELEETGRSDELIVSDHAVLRYLERVKGLDIKALRQEILTDELKSLHTRLGNGKYPIETGSDKGRAVINNNIIVTVEAGKDYQRLINK